MCRLGLPVAVAVLVAGAHGVETRDCAHGDDQCVIGADHALLATKMQVSKMMVWGREAAAAERTKVSMEAQPVPPVSTTMKCVISVTILYFIVYTSLFLVSSAQDATGQKYELHETLVDACDTVVYAPMISVLFIVTRMRAIAITKGDPEAYGLPQWWCKDAMVLSACCVFALTFCCIVEKVLPAMARILTFAQYLADALLYAGFAVVAYGLYSMDTPASLGTSTPVSETALCVMTLTFFYFAVAILHQAGCTYDLFTGSASTEKTEDAHGGHGHHGSFFTRVMHHGLKALDFAPQICILFLGARMRALQLGHSDPQAWALYFFHGATYAIITYAIVICAHYWMGQNKFCSFMEGLSLLVLHASTIAVIASVFTIEAVVGPTPFISTTVRVIMCMTVLYFFVHTVLFISEQLVELEFVQSTWGVETFTACMESVGFVPMMCALFLGTRMRALQLSHNTGAPQGWAQDFMMLATWAIFIDLLVVLAEHAFGSPDDKHIVSRCFQALCLCVMHVSTSAVIASIFLQTVENTSVNGADTLIPGFKIPGRA
jgi:hypothetical protein